MPLHTVGGPPCLEEERLAEQQDVGSRLQFGMEGEVEAVLEDLDGMLDAPRPRAFAEPDA